MTTAPSTQAACHANNRANIHRLYWYHALASCALAYIGSDFFSTRLILHYLDKSQYGLIAGVGLWVPTIVNLLVAPYILNLGINRSVVAFGTLARIVISLLFILLPILTLDRTILTIGFTIIYVVWMIFPTVANNSLYALIRSHVPEETLGHHSAVMYWLWDFPFRLIGIGCAWYLTRRGDSDPHYLRTVLILLIITGAVQLPATYFVFRLTPVNHYEKVPALPFMSIFQPFRDQRFRTISSAVFAVTTLMGMVSLFFYSFITEGLGWTPLSFAWIGAIMSIIGFAFVPLWGRLADRVGGKNIYGS